MSITASAPGKLVLFGDHAAVYGYPCLVTAVDLRFYVKAEHSDQSYIQIETPELRSQGTVRHIQLTNQDGESPKETAFMEAAIKEFFKNRQLKNGIRLTTHGPLVTFGLGSSSAITVATIKALAMLMDIELSSRQIFDLSYAAVLSVQGAGSGVDVAAAVYGGTVYYVKGGAQLEIIKTPPLPILIGYSGEKVQTTNYITQVKMLQKRHMLKVNQIFSIMEAIVEDAKTTIIAGDWQTLGELANMHQGLLDAFGVVTPQLFLPIYAARISGAWGAKLSGAGGGDCMFAVVSTNKSQAIADSIQQAGGQIVNLPVAAQGVRIEPS
ncbi:MAG: mevalonate kinase [Anaerolineae bacterium]|nr:mevalonate kinase [Anaerolineae bacterium]